MKTRTLSLPVPREIAGCGRNGSTRLAVCSDFHSVNRRMKTEASLARLADAAPDFVLCPGDFFNQSGERGLRECFNENGFRFLEDAGKIAPVFFSTGNHEQGLSPENRTLLEDAGVTVLDGEFVRRGPLLFGGCSSGYPMGHNRTRNAPGPDPDFLRRYAAQEGWHILLCHHPEYWESGVAPLGIELTVAGHAHGGQWRLFGRGIYAPGQGFLPKYTSGLYRRDPEGGPVLAVSRGMTNSVTMVPRFFNPCEILVIDLVPEDMP